MASGAPILGEIRMMSGHQVPEGWAPCDGRLLNVGEHQDLYGLLGTTYGGDGRVSFAVPDLRGRGPVHINQLHQQGQLFGWENHTLTIDEMPAHAHLLFAEDSDGESADPGERLLARTPGAAYFVPLTEPLAMTPAIGETGGGQGHDNMMPFTVLNYCIALQGDWPVRPTKDV